MIADDENFSAQCIFFATIHNCVIISEITLNTLYITLTVLNYKEELFHHDCL